MFRYFVHKPARCACYFLVVSGSCRTGLGVDCLIIVRLGSCVAVEEAVIGAQQYTGVYCFSHPLLPSREEQDTVSDHYTRFERHLEGQGLLFVPLLPRL